MNSNYHRWYYHQIEVAGSETVVVELIGEAEANCIYSIV